MKKVCLIRLSSLGDIVMTSALFPILQKAGFEIHYITKTPFSGLLRTDPRISSVYSFDKKKSGSEAKARKQLLDWVEANKFDLIIDLHDSWRTWYWRFWLKKMAAVLVVNKPRIREIAVLFFRLKSLGFGAGGRIERMQRMVENYLGIQRIEAIRSGNLNKVSAFENPPIHYFVLAPGSAWSSKRWPSEKFSTLVKSFPQFAVYVLGSKEEAFCDDIAASSGHPESISLRGKTSTEEILQIIQGAKFVVGNDTGIVHIADAFGKPTVVIEGPTEKSLGFSPGGKNTKLLGLDLICRPCSKSGKICWRLGSRKCLEELPVENVVHAVENLIGIKND